MKDENTFPIQKTKFKRHFFKFSTEIEIKKRECSDANKFLDSRYEREV